MPRDDGVYLSIGGDLIWVTPRMLAGWLFNAGPATAGDEAWAKEILENAGRDMRTLAAVRRRREE